MTGTTYWRRLYVQVPPDESTPESRLHAATELAELLCNHPMNTYRVPFKIDPETLDMTPENEDERPSMDEYLMDTDIVEHIRRFLEMPPLESNWAQVNSPIANNYFSGPVYPDIARTTLGYTNALLPAPVAEGINN
eukprot:scaffold51340_cov62-Attheya_sp.AAC.4